MPARSRPRTRFAGCFAAADQAWFIWPPLPVPPKPPEVRAPAPPKKPRARSRGQTLPPDVREILDDRIFAAIDAGLIDPLDDGEDVADTVAPTWGELNRLRMILLREEFEPLKPASRPTNCPPGSAGKVAEMERRTAAGEELFARHDADPLADDRLGVDVLGRGRANLTIEVADAMIEDEPSNRGHGLNGGGGMPRDKRPHRQLPDD